VLRLIDTLCLVKEMARGLRYKTLRWKWVDEIEPSYVVAIKSGEILKGMTMAQVTVRMHSKQVYYIPTLYRCIHICTI
jgi:hypothetical protein